MKNYKYIILLSLIILLGCNSKTTTVIINETPPIDSNSLYSIRYDKSRKVIDEYKSKEFKKMESENNLSMKEGYDAKIKKIEIIRTLKTYTNRINGNIEGIDLEKNSSAYLEK